VWALRSSSGRAKPRDLVEARVQPRGKRLRALPNQRVATRDEPIKPSLHQCSESVAISR